jgi:hypothetical protein
MKWFLLLLSTLPVLASVNLENGTVFFSHQDIFHEKLSINRVYNSKATQIHSFGQAQAAIWDEQLEIKAKSVIFRRFGLGREYVFLNKNKKWIGPENFQLEKRGKLFELQVDEKSTLVFDDNGFLGKIQGADKKTFQFKRNANGLVTGVFLNKKKLYTVNYNLWGLVSSIRQGKKSTSYKYDKYKRLLSVTKNGVHHLDYIYDHAKYPFIREIAYQEKLMESYSYHGHDLSYRVKSWKNQGKELRFSYAEQPKKKNVTIANKAYTRSLSYDYLDEKMLKMAIKTIRGENGLHSVAYNSKGQILREVINGATYDYKYDDKLRLIGKASNYSKVELRYDKLGRPLSYLYSIKKEGKWIKEVTHEYEYASRKSFVAAQLKVNGKRYGYKLKPIEGGFLATYKKGAKTVLSIEFDNQGVVREASVHGKGRLKFSDPTNPLIVAIKKTGKSNVAKEYELLNVMTHFRKQL